LPGIWLCFSFTYSRGGIREFPLRSRFLVLAALLVPVSVSLLLREHLGPVFHQSLSGETWGIRPHAATKILNGSLLLVTVLVLMNLEKTFRSAVGTMRWRIKFLILGLVIVFGARIYALSQGVLFSRQVLALTDVDTAALLIGCVLMAVAFLRSGFGEIDVYPSHAVLRTSLTVLLVGAYLFFFGVLAQAVAGCGG